MYKSGEIVLYFCLIKFANCFLYDVGESVLFQPANNGYFGYSVFLQQSDPSFVVVGSPTTNVTGCIHICKISDDRQCSPYFPETTDKGLYYMYGASIDGGAFKGDPVMVCAPKFTKTHIYPQNGYDDVHYFVNGACDIFNNMNELADYQKLFPNSGVDQIYDAKYYLAFGEAGVSLSYLNDSGEFILGSPGISGWSGSAIRISEIKIELPPQTREVSHTRSARKKYAYSHIKRLIEHFKEYDYAGYSVTTGSFKKQKSHYVIGVPRGNELRGSVYIIEKNDYGTPLTLTPEKNDAVGTYFGSSVCTADVNGDGLDDLLVGAPFRKNKEYNDGAVYEYRNDGEKLLLNQIITSPSESASGQFGTAMTNLGKVALGSADTVVISSPYENNGKGALYIYIGSSGGLIYNSKIKRDELQSLGYSLSRGVDVDYNGVVDIAAGAYKSNKVVVFKAKPVFYYKFNVVLSTNLYSYKKNPPFKFSYCISLEKVPTVETTVNIKFDKRLQNTNKVFTTTISNKHCEDIEISLQDNLEEFTKPIVISLEASEKSCPSCPVASPIFQKSHKHKIPFLYDCGSDQICTPNIEIKTNLDNSSFLVGTRDTLKLIVDVNNKNEYAYLCKLELQFQKEILLKTFPKFCIDNLCTLKNPIDKKDTLEFNLDFEKFRYVIPDLSIGMKIDCLNYTRNFLTHIKLTYENKYSSEGSHDSYIYKNKNITGVVNGNFLYIIKNEGPSPVRNEEFSFRIPRTFRELESEKILDVFEPKIDESRISCKANMKYSSADETLTELGKEAILPAGIIKSEKPDKITCEDSHIECMEIKCTIQELIKGKEFTVQIPVKPNIKKILQYYSPTFTINSEVNFMQGGEQIITISSIILQDNVEGTYISIFWAIFGVIIGLLLLGAVIFGLYKLNFFKRQSYDKMKEQENEQRTEELFELSNENGAKQTQDSNPE